MLQGSLPPAGGRGPAQQRPEGWQRRGTVTITRTQKARQRHRCRARARRQGESHAGRCEAHGSIKDGNKRRSSHPLAGGVALAVVPGASRKLTGAAAAPGPPPPLLPAALGWLLPPPLLVLGPALLVTLTPRMAVPFVALQALGQAAGGKWVRVTAWQAAVAGGGMLGARAHYPRPPPPHRPHHPQPAPRLRVCPGAHSWRPAPTCSLCGRIRCRTRCPRCRSTAATGATPRSRCWH